MFPAANRLICSYTRIRSASRIPACLTLLRI